MIYRSFIFFLLLILHSSLFGQNPNFPVGSRAVGMGDASITLNDAWSIFNNPGGLSGVESSALATSFENRYGLEGLNLITAAYVQPTKLGAFGVGVYRFGDELFNQQKASIGYSNTFGIVSLGGRFNVLQYFTEGFDPQTMFTFDFGGIGQITPQIFFGAFVTNINQARVSRNEDERVPTYLKTGFSYRPNKKVMINAEVEKEVIEPAYLKFGAEYFIIDQMPLRIGFNTDTYTAFFGLGFHYYRFQVDYVGYNHSSLGLSNGISINYRFK